MHQRKTSVATQFTFNISMFVSKELKEVLHLNSIMYMKGGIY